MGTIILIIQGSQYTNPSRKQQGQNTGVLGEQLECPYLVHLERKSEQATDSGQYIVNTEPPELLRRRMLTIMRLVPKHADHIWTWRVSLLEPGVRV